MKFILKLTAVLLPGVFWAGGAYAATPPTPQFDVLGFIQEATLDTAGAICTPAGDNPNVPNEPTDRLRGGTIMVNGQKLIIPCNTLLQLPAATMMWADLFDPAVSQPVSQPLDPNNPTGPSTLLGTVPAHSVGPTGEPQTGLALSDNQMPFPSFEVRVQGNVVNGQYIVGLIVPITQQGLNATSGLISYIDYAIGAFRVGGIPNDTACSANGITSPLCSGVLVQVNDPVGRWGKKHSPDPRFSGDFENSTISATTGIPVCIPRVAPPGSDPECPLKNRPANGSSFGDDVFLDQGAPLKVFTMPTPSQADADANQPDPRKQVPMMVGDQVIIAGTLFKIDPLGPETAANTYVSAHTVDDNLGIFTQPGVPPAYVRVEDLLIGTNGAAIQGINQEASTRLTTVGFTSDPSKPVDIYAQDVNPCTGEETLRLLATTDPSTQPVKGRFVHRVLGGNFMPPTRNYVVKSQTQAVNSNGIPVELVAANGIVTGQFLLPNFEYIFPENHTIGDPFIPFNFQDLPFLAQGSGPVDGFGTVSPILGQLDPWPGSAAPVKATCTAVGTAPIANAGSDITVLANAPVTLAGTMTQDPKAGTALIAWTAPQGITLLNGNTLTPSFTAPNINQGSAPVTLNFTLTVKDAFGSSSDTVTVTVNPTGDIVNVTVATWNVQRGQRGGFGRLAVTATTNDLNATLSLTEIGTDGIVYDWGTGTLTGSTPAQAIFNWIELKGAQQPTSLTIRSSKGGSITVNCGTPNARGLVTCQ